MDATDKSIKDEDNFKKENQIKKNISDIRTTWWWDINLDNEDFVKIEKNYTPNFDSIVWRRKSFFERYIFKYFKKIQNFINFQLKKNDIKGKKIKIENYSKNKYSKLKNTDIYSFLDKYFFVYFKRFQTIIIIVFIVLILAYIDKIIIESKVNSGYNNLISIKDTRDEQKIKNLVKESINDFRISNFLYFPFSIIPIETFQTPKHIIKWWKQISYTINNLLKVYNNINNKILEKWINNIEITPILQDSKEEIFAMENDLKKALKEYNAIKSLNYGNLNTKFEIWKKYLNIMESYLSNVTSNYQTFLNILWDKKVKKYLIVFQNADEIRPTWGFMWSMSFVDIYKWKITNFETKDIYQLEWDLKSIDYQKQNAPEWLNQITQFLGLRDSNYFANVDSSSESINFFMKKLWYDLDWIIFINNVITEDYLNITWEIDFKKIDEKINSSNFSAIMSLLVESKLFKDWRLWTPKQILFDFIEEFKTKLINDWNYLSYFKAFMDNITKRDIMVYSFSPKENDLLKELWLNWEIDYTKTLDFAYPVFTSISWNKSNRYLERKYEKFLTQHSDCSIDTSLKISLTHNMTINDENMINDIIKKYEIPNYDHNMFIQWRWDNWEFVKVLLPKEAIIRESDMYKIYSTNSLKYVTFYLKTPRFNTNFVIINYTLPNYDCADYKFKFYKQSWIRAYDFIYKDKEKTIEKRNITSDLSY